MGCAQSTSEPPSPRGRSSKAKGKKRADVKPRAKKAKKSRKAERSGDTSRADNNSPDEPAPANPLSMPASAPIAVVPSPHAPLLELPAYDHGPAAKPNMTPLSDWSTLQASASSGFVGMASPPLTALGTSSSQPTSSGGNPNFALPAGSAVRGSVSVLPSMRSGTDDSRHQSLQGRLPRGHSMASTNMSSTMTTTQLDQSTEAAGLGASSSFGEAPSSQRPPSVAAKVSAPSRTRNPSAALSAQEQKRQQKRQQMLKGTYTELTTKGTARIRAWVDGGCAYSRSVKRLPDPDAVDLETSTMIATSGPRRPSWVSVASTPVPFDLVHRKPAGTDVTAGNAGQRDHPPQAPVVPRPRGNDVAWQEDVSVQSLQALAEATTTSRSGEHSDSPARHLLAAPVAAN